MNNKYNYPKLERVDTEIGRFYKDSNQNLVPSVTTVLSNTSDKSNGINEWRLRVGDEEADRVNKAKHRHRYLCSFSNRKLFK